MPTTATPSARIIAAFGSTAHGAIDACRSGGERLGDALGRRWDSAFEQASPRLSAETRRNATRTRKVVARCWREGLELSTAGASIAVDTLVNAAGTALERAQAVRAGRA